jgi:hypothetical protein
LISINFNNHSLTSEFEAAAVLVYNAACCAGCLRWAGKAMSLLQVSFVSAMLNYYTYKFLIPDWTRMQRCSFKLHNETAAAHRRNTLKIALNRTSQQPIGCFQTNDTHQHDAASEAEVAAASDGATAAVAAAGDSARQLCSSAAE